MQIGGKLQVVRRKSSKGVSSGCCFSPCACVCVFVFGQYDFYQPNEGLRDGGGGAEGRKAGKRLPKPIRSRAEDRGLATITALIEVRVVNLVVN